MFSRHPLSAEMPSFHQLSLVYMAPVDVTDAISRVESYFAVGQVIITFLLCNKRSPTLSKMPEKLVDMIVELLYQSERVP